MRRVRSASVGLRRLVLLAGLLLAATPGSAASARALHGIVLDPRGDLTPPLVGQNDDLASVQMYYFPRAGILQGTVRTYFMNVGSEAGAWFDFYADAGRWRYGRCDLSVSARTHFYTPDDAPGPPALPDARITRGGKVSGWYTASFDYAAGYRTDVYTFADPRLRRRGFTCVTNIALQTGNGKAPYGSTDLASGFRLRPGPSSTGD